MKVLHLNTYDAGGAFIAANRFHQEMKKQGIDSSFLVLKKYGNEDGIHEYISLKRPIFIRIKESIKYRIQRYIYWFAERILKKNEYSQLSLPISPYDITLTNLYQDADIISFHYVQKFIDFQSFFRKNKKPIVWVLHDENPFNGLYHYYLSNNSSIDRLIAKYKYRMYNKCSLSFISPSNWISKKLHEKLTTANNQVIHYGLNPINKISIKKNNINIGSSSFDFKEKRKGFYFLQCIYDEIAGYHQTNVIIIGKRPENTCIIDNLLYTGFLDNQADLMNAFSNLDIFIITTIIDNLPNVVLEAMSCGLPIIAFNVGGISDMVFDGVNGYLISPFDIPTFVSKLKILIQNGELRRKMGQNSRRIVKEKFNIAQQTEKYIKTLYRALDNVTFSVNRV